MNNRDGRYTRREFGRSLFSGISRVVGASLLLPRFYCASALAGDEDKMPRRRLGNTGYKISGVSFSASLIGKTGWGPLERLLQLGGSYIDTAPFYGSCDEILGRNLLSWRDEVILSTRWKSDGTASAEELLDSFEKSRVNLKTDTIDIVINDNVKSAAQLKCVGSREAFSTLKSQGKVKFRGFAARTDTKDLLEEAMNISGFDFVILSYNILNYREFRKTVEKMQRNGIGVVAADVIEPSLENPSLARRLLGKKDESLAVASIKWVINENGIASVLVPVKREEEAEEYARAAIDAQD